MVRKDIMGMVYGTRLLCSYNLFVSLISFSLHDDFFFSWWAMLNIIGHCGSLWLSDISNMMVCLGQTITANASATEALVL